MKEPSPGQADILVHEVPQRGMGEVVARRAFTHDGPHHQPVQGVDGLLFRPAAGVAHGGDIERSPDDRGRSQDLGPGLIDRIETGAQDRAHPGGYRSRVADPGRGQRLHHVEREAFGGIPDAGPVCRGQVGRTEPVHQHLHGAGRQPVQDEPRRGRGRQRLQRTGGRRRDVLVAPGQEEDQGAVGETPGEDRECLQRRGVRPMQVVDPEDARGCPGGQRRKAIHDRSDEAGVGGGVGRATARGTTPGRLQRRDQASEFCAGRPVERLQTWQDERVAHRGAKQVDDGPVGDRPFRSMTAGGEDRAPIPGDPPDHRLAESGLADPRLAGEGHHPSVPICRDRLDHRVDRPDRRTATDERTRLVIRGRRGDDRRRRRLDGDRRRRNGASVADGLIALRRGRQRRHPEFPLQDGHAAPVLANRRGLVPGTGVQVHEPNVRALVERVQVQPTTGRRKRGRQVAVRLGGRRKSIQDPEYEPIDGDGPARSPVIELRAVTKVEAGQERPSCQRRGRRKVVPRPTAGEPLHLGQVHPDKRVVERHPRALDAQRVAVDGATHDRQGPTQGAVGGGLVGLGPQEGRQFVAGIGAAVSGEQGQDGHSLARVHRQGPASHQHLGRAEKADVQGRHGRASRHPRNGTAADRHPVTFR